MHIKEVESLVGLKVKNIRYYEDMGLIKPSRNNQNDYRIYSDEDIKKLRIIKFLRELNIPIKEIKQLFDGEITLSNCMNDAIDKIEVLEENCKKVKLMCSEIIKNNDSIESIDSTKYFLEMNVLNKEGFTMRDVKTNNWKKIRGAILSSLVFSIFFILMVCMITYFQFTETDSMSWIAYGILMFVLLIPIFGIFYNLVIRIKEIKGGEEDEASKY